MTYWGCNEFHTHFVLCTHNNVTNSKIETTLKSTILKKQFRFYFIRMAFFSSKQFHLWNRIQIIFIFFHFVLYSQKHTHTHWYSNWATKRITWYFGKRWTKCIRKGRSWSQRIITDGYNVPWCASIVAGYTCSYSWSLENFTVRGAQIQQFILIGKLGRCYFWCCIAILTRMSMGTIGMDCEFLK